MYRKIMSYLKAWKESAHRKPLILQGARQVGNIIVAGSLPGVAVNRGKFSFPVGKIDIKPYILWI